MACSASANTRSYSPGRPLSPPVFVYLFTCIPSSRYGTIVEFGGRPGIFSLNPSGIPSRIYLPPELHSLQYEAHMRLRIITAAALLLAAFRCAGELSGNTVWQDQKLRIRKNAAVNRERVGLDMKAAGLSGETVWYAVPAMSDSMRLMDSYPYDGIIAGEIRAVLAGNESESASFQVFSFADFEKADVKMTELTCGDEKLEADIRVVKLWFQNGNAWVSYFDDSGLKLTPELLLHDENMIRVDLENAENHARVFVDGKETYRWISAPKPISKPSYGGFNQYDPGFTDADTMQPVTLKKHEFKQFFITARAKKNQKGGVYRGKVSISAGGKPLCEIPVAFRVLPFELPLPATYDDTSVPYIYDCRFAVPTRERRLAAAGGDEMKSREYYRKWMQSLYDHSLFNAPVITPKTEEWEFEVYREIGFPLEGATGEVWTGWLGLNHGGRMNYKQHKLVWKCAKEADEFYHKKLGLKDVRLCYADEQGAGFVVAHRDLWDAYLNYGFGIGFFGGHALLAYKGGHNTGMYKFNSLPDDEAAIRMRKNMGARYMGVYACQHTGSENPQFTRRQHGLLGYFSGLNMTWNYEFAIGDFNDRAKTPYRPMVISYANSQGLMETIEYAGFREGCDDIRYATVALRLAEEGAASPSIEAKRLAGRIRHYLATLDKKSFDLNEVRAELIEFILLLRKALGK